MSLKKKSLFSIYTYIDRATSKIVPNFAVCPEHLIRIIHCSLQDCMDCSCWKMYFFMLQYLTGKALITALLLTHMHTQFGGTAVFG